MKNSLVEKALRQGEIKADLLYAISSFFIVAMILAIALVRYVQRTINSNRKIMATKQELQSLFNTLDTDRDGKVSINELFLSPGLSAIISAQTGISSPGFAFVIGNTKMV
jgi:hypothetical protein